MQVILLERIEKLGQMGDLVTVKNGYARNFLVPQGKAMRATKANLAEFERRKVELEGVDVRTVGEQVVAQREGRVLIRAKSLEQAEKLIASAEADGGRVVAMVPGRATLEDLFLTEVRG